MIVRHRENSSKPAARPFSEPAGLKCPNETKALVFLLLTGLLSAQAAIKFAGYGKIGGIYRFALCDDVTSANGWVVVGDVFQGYKLTDFDAIREELVLVGKEETLHLALPAPRVSAERRWDPAKGAELKALLEEMRPQSAVAFRKPFPIEHYNVVPKKLPTIEDYIAVATVYGLVITDFTVGESEVSIEMGVPFPEADVKGGEIVRTTTFGISSQGRNGQPKRSLKIRF